MIQSSEWAVVLLAKNGFWIKHKNEFKHLNLKIEHETHKSVDVWTIIKNDFWNINRPNSKKKHFSEHDGWTKMHENQYFFTL